MTRKPEDHLEEILAKIPTTSRRAEGNEKHGVPGPILHCYTTLYTFHISSLIQNKVNIEHNQYRKINTEQN